MIKGYRRSSVCHVNKHKHLAYPSFPRSWLHNIWTLPKPVSSFGWPLPHSIEMLYILSQNIDIFNIFRQNVENGNPTQEINIFVFYIWSLFYHIIHIYICDPGAGKISFQEYIKHQIIFGGNKNESCVTSNLALYQNSWYSLHKESPHCLDNLLLVLFQRSHHLLDHRYRPLTNHIFSQNRKVLSLKYS